MTYVLYTALLAAGVTAYARWPWRDGSRAACR